MSALLLHTGPDFGLHDLVGIVLMTPWFLVVTWLYSKVVAKRALKENDDASEDQP
jgi:hypothetical protein